MRIEMVNLPAGEVYLEDGSSVPITNMYDAWEDECDWPDAVAVVAGPVDGKWLTIDLDELDGEVTIH